MYLKTLEIQGFKSFPDKVKLEFGQGITSIVGPNGSGKSNISDAVQWVLGEQSAKSLRGTKMEDIIFAGTEERKPLGFAAVSLTFDNSDHALPLDYNEVTITRRIYRSGESEYFINKSSCRLKDIQELFMDTGVGKDGYSIIGQGKIAEILSTKSEDRRLIFEEAAGITKYRYRKQEAEKKLDLTCQNLTRLKDIINELELQIEPLYEQAETAKKFLKLKEELKELEINVAIIFIENSKKQLEEINKDFTIVSEQIIASQQSLEQSENQLEQINAEIKEKDNYIEMLRNDLFGQESALERLKNSIQLLENNILHNEENMKKLNTEINEIEEKLILLQKEIVEKNSLLEDYLSKKTNLQDEIQLLEEKNQTIINYLDSENKNIDDLKADIIEQMNLISDTKVKLNSLNVLENNFAKRKTVVNQEIQQKEKNIKDLEKVLSDLNLEYQSVEEQIQKGKAAFEEEKKKLETANQQHQNFEKEYNRLVGIFKEKQSKKNLLEDMEKSYEGYYKSVKNILIEAEKGQLKDLNIYGTLAQLIRVPEKYVTAIEVALGSAMQNIVVDSEEDAKRSIEFLKKNRLGRATFLPISSVKGSVLNLSKEKIANYSGYVGIASQLIDFEHKYTGIVNSLLGSVVIVEDIDSGIAMARAFQYRFRIVTLEGEVLNRGGSLSGGSLNKVNSFLSRSKEIEALGSELKDLYTKIQNLKDEKAAKGVYISKLGESLQQFQDKISQYENHRINIQWDLKHNQSSYETEIQAKNQLLQEEKQLEEEISNTRFEAEKLENIIKELEEQIQDIENKISKKQEGYSQEREVMERLNQSIVEKKILLNSLDKDISTVKDRIKNLQHEIAYLSNSKEQKNKEYCSIEINNKEIQNEIEDKNKQIHGGQNKIAELKNLVDCSLAAKKEKEQKVIFLQEELKKTREEISLLQQEHHRIESKKIRVEVELDKNINKLWDEYEETYTTALKYRKDIGSLTQAQKQINFLKNAIKDLGNVNVQAIEEYKNVSERYEFLSVQKKDLEEAEEGLVKIIDEMYQLMQKQFAENFKIINETFNLVFNQLFGGGKASLKLSDPHNILESGIEIEVQPPGKKLQNITLLSGGEKAFTAIAILFAILKVRPTPFCIFDEIEAALDEVNVYRFANYLKNYSKNTQFVIVTHRRGTMEAADTLYGVTMQEKGVSKLISLKMEDVAS